MKRSFVVALATAGMLGLAGCGSMTSAPEPPSLDGTTWVLASLPSRAWVGGAAAAARFEAARIQVADGCNH